MNKLRTIDHVSPSQLILYENCPHLWYLRYVKSYWPPKTHALKFGIAFHDGVEQMMKNWGSNAALDNAGSKFDDSYIFGQHGEEPDKWCSKAYDMYQRLFSGLETFESFEPLETEITIQKDLLKGRIDCLAKIDGEKYIIDWKSGSYPYSEERIDTDLQLTAYCWLTDNEYKPAFILVTKGSPRFYFYPARRTKGDLARFKNYMDSVIWQMENRKFFPKNTDFCSSYGGCTALKDGLCEGSNDF